jgi:hypothetical protein
MTNFVSGPTTYEQVRWAATSFRGQADDATYADARNPEFRDALMGQDNGAAVAQLARLLNSCGSHVSDDQVPGIAAAIQRAAPVLQSLAASALEFDDLRCATLDIIETAFENIASADGVGPSTASRILAILNPRFFVQWDSAIRDAYFPNDEPNGATYAQFLTVMRMAALSIAADARAQHGIDDPAVQISHDLGINPPFTLAKFIDEYNWLTLERGMVYQGGAVAV